MHGDELHLSHLRVIPQGTIADNLGPDRLAVPKALDLQSFQSTTNPLIAQPLSESHVMNCACLWARHLPLLILLMPRICLSSIRYNF